MEGGSESDIEKERDRGSSSEECKRVTRVTLLKMENELGEREGRKTHFLV